MMPSQSVSKFRSQIQPVIAGALETAEEVGQALAEVYDLFLEEGETGIDWTLLQKLISRRLAGKGLRLAELDSRLEVSRTRDKQLRRERQRVVVDLRRELRSARFLLDESLGREVATGFFRVRDFSQLDPVALVALSRETAASLRSSPGLDGIRAAAGVLPEPMVVAEALERRALELEQQVESLAPKRKRETFEVGEKGQELREAYSTRLRSQDLLFGLYRAAGKDHLATRLRPKVRARAEQSDNLKAQGGNENAANTASPAAGGMAADARQ